MEHLQICRVAVCRRRRPTVEHGLRAGSELGYSSLPVHACAALLACFWRRVVGVAPRHGSRGGAVEAAARRRRDWQRGNSGLPAGEAAARSVLAARWQRASGGKSGDRWWWWWWLQWQKNTACMYAGAATKEGLTCGRHARASTPPVLGLAPCVERVGARHFRPLAPSASSDNNNSSSSATAGAPRETSARCGGVQCTPETTVAVAAAGGQPSPRGLVFPWARPRAASIDHLGP